MTHVLIIGAGGYIGQAIASSLLRSGNYTVYGLTRSPEKAKRLSSLEIIPVNGSVTDNAEYTELIRSGRIDIVIEASNAGSDTKHVLADLKKISKERLDKAAAASVKVAKLGFIYCSGIWVHGTSRMAVNELTPTGVAHAPGQSAKIVAWRPAFEQEVIASADVLDVMIVRPALVYGRAGDLWGVIFGPIMGAIQSGEKELTLPLEVDSRLALIHVDDVATGIHAAVEKLSLIAGTGVYPVFDLVGSHESMRDIVESAARDLGFSGSVHFKGAGDNLLMQALCTSVNGSSTRAMTLLGWQPKRVGFVQRMDIFVKAWLASQS